MLKRTLHRIIRSPVAIFAILTIVIILTVWLTAPMGRAPFFEPFYQNWPSLLLAWVAVWLAFIALQMNTKVEKQRLEFEQKKFNAEEDERQKLIRFREQEYKRFSQPAADLAQHLAQILTDDPHWAHRALEAAKLLPYTNTLFDERSQHFRAEKEELAARFTPYLLNRCQMLASNGKREVYLLIDAGTTLYPFFELIGKESARRRQRGEKWINHFHLATNNLPGIEQLIRTGRLFTLDRYTKLAIEDCLLLPGIPVPIFAAVAGDLTDAAIKNLRTEENRDATFIALVVGNWIRIRNSDPRCPVPMARGDEHRSVKQTLVDIADEIFVVSPLGKIFVGYENDTINEALGFTDEVSDPEKAPYRAVDITNNKAQTVKLVATTRTEGRILYRHSNKVEDALLSSTRKIISEDEFAVAPQLTVEPQVRPLHPLNLANFADR